MFPDDNDHCISWENYSSSKIPLHQGHAKGDGNNLHYLESRGKTGIQMSGNS